MEIAMATARKRLTAEERIAAYEKKIKEIKQAEKEKSKSKGAALTRNSEGLDTLFAEMDKVAKKYKLTIPQLVKEIIRIRRTGLKIAD